MVGIALLGAGIFALEQHLPAIEAAPSSFELKAVYSRSQKSAESLASSSSSSVDVYFDTPAVEGKSLDDLLKREDIEAVVVVLPIPAQPGVIRRAVEAGKHVLSEKPVAKDVEAARGLVSWYEGEKRGELWAVAENWRYLESLEVAAAKVWELVTKREGRVTSFRLERFGFVAEGDKYFNTEWRKVPEYQGGFVLDGGIHFIAGLRMLLAAGGEEISSVACFSSLLEERLVPVDTVHAVATTQTGRNGTIAISFGTEFKRGTQIEILTTAGSVVWTPVSVTTVVKNEKGEMVEEVKEFKAGSTGVDREVVAFGEAIRRGSLEARQTPAEALKDLEIVQGLLESGEAKGAVKNVGP
ncbi:hypothetical protein QBC47DRAFT_373165 [Echria macrotheca]|uniref:Uncharacterized protein n=1 Tax=Echria macrotheca TaxID=438768 RepID=A0AAJ0FG78_9PEZI|nr:hypothetical protein QBC47DRAFT_373165 [Echria macrotheca]